MTQSLLTVDKVWRKLVENIVTKSFAIQLHQLNFLAVHELAQRDDDIWTDPVVRIQTRETKFRPLAKTEKCRGGKDIFYCVGKFILLQSVYMNIMWNVQVKTQPNTSLFIFVNKIYCSKNNQILRIQSELVTFGSDATITVWFIWQMYCM